MDMVTGMANMEIRKTAKIIILTTTLTVYHATAKDIDFGTNASSKLTFSDNINSSSNNNNSGFVSTWSAGVHSNIKGHDGKLLFQYDVYQTIHSIDASRNELFNELAFSADKKIYRSNIKFNADASITNIARLREDNANADIISGNTIETQDANVGLSYQSNPNGIIDLYTGVSGGITSNEDDIANYHSYDADLLLQNGTSVKSVFWSTDYSYSRNISRNTENEYYDFILSQEIGLQPIKSISPLIRRYYEGYTDDEENLVESGHWGPGIRYYWHERSYAELAYNYSFKDEDFWSGYLRLNPTPRTFIEFDYTNRFYGDAYYFSLSHRNKKITNTIEYSEQLIAFDREFFVVGEDVEEYKLVKGLNLSSTLNLRRSSFTTKIRVVDRTPVSDIDSDDRGGSKTYGASISASHRLSQYSFLSGGFQYDKDYFDTKSKKNYYRVYDLSFNQRLSDHVSWDTSLKRTDSNVYSENRVNFMVRLTY